MEDVLKFIAILCSTIITIVLGLKISGLWTGLGPNIALILSAILTALNTWDAFAKYETRATQERANINKLEILFKRIILYQSGNEDLKLEQYKTFEREYHLIQEEYMEQRETINKNQSEQQNQETKNFPT